MTVPKSRSLFERLVDAYNQKDLGAALELYSEDFEFWSPLDGWTQGIGSRREHLERLFSILPDEQLVPKIVVANESTVVARLMSIGSGENGEGYSLPLAMVLVASNGVFARGRTYVDPRDVEEAIQNTE